VLHQGADDGGGNSGLRANRYANRLITQPSAAVSAGRLLLAFNNSTSPFFGDPTAGSEITLLYASDGGASWSRRSRLLRPPRPIRSTSTLQSRSAPAAQGPSSVTMCSS